MQYKLIDVPLPSRRGNYNLAILDSNPLRWEPVPLDMNNERVLEVIREVWFAQNKQLEYHKYWQNEPVEFIQAYQSFYAELFSLEWLHKNEDRHNIVVNKDCCLTLVQYTNHKLIAYSRSTDMRNGYHSDRLLLNYLAQQINSERPDCQVITIEWHLAIPHVYLKKGIARLEDKEPNK